MTECRPDKTISGYRLVNTCWAAPEQYDVFKGERKVGYLRHRHGIATVHFPTAGGELLLSWPCHSDGPFEDHERQLFFVAAIASIDARLDKEASS